SSCSRHAEPALLRRRSFRPTDDGAMPSTPIAIVGQACVLPGALTPEALWASVVEGRSAVTAAPAGRFRLDAARVVAEDGGADRTFTDRGGYVTGFDAVWDPQGFALPAAALR